MKAEKPSVLERLQDRTLNFISNQYISISTEPDGMGYYYGQLLTDDATSHTINILPVTKQSIDNDYNEELVLQVFIDGLQVAECHYAGEVNTLLTNVQRGEMAVEPMGALTEEESSIN